MKEITFTRLRADLSQILDEIRDGETFIVTQRGKESVMLGQNNNKSSTSKTNALDNEILKAMVRNAVSAINANKVTPSIVSQEVEALGRMIKLQGMLDKTTIDALQQQTASAEKPSAANQVSVKEAVEEVRKRHAKTIRNLEGK
ncbi:type II toxin-antitoxin system prevent-host-death family antitoxin [Serratia proteamaculans]|uniref:Antitoxin n=1 Tax=Serratia proteamaculans TaxID=28151 RepID=A0A7U0N4T1_SERPR|nr:type II toxin-antitoxin system prevent-host-death family antitoxin [Serratia proteamaculans]MBO1504250.1 type II toxin-antitoxin system prevent-host-death family antitoxin [Serratia proteamaculans]MDW5512326.1 type II toxin-antitoxin system prevent-host-death family antitoxin [Serratia proteamaculans]QQX52566.1 type II toxin-antitoxin system prevent-host-death family antitoxin [Serratia proteamaculans]